MPFKNRKIVCLCGSTRYYEEFMRVNHYETRQGNIVLTVGSFGNRPELPWMSVRLTDADKVSLDALHKDKIRMCDEVVVIGAHRGESLKGELELANELRKPIRYEAQHA